MSSNKISDKNLIFALIIISLAYYLTIVNKMFNIYILDMGRDLYVSLRTMRGDLFLRDFDYPYGFVMPYIYSLFYGLFGVSIKSFNIALMVMQIMIIAATYITARLILPKFYSFICALTLLLAYYALPGVQPNHIGGQLFGIISLYLMLKYFLVMPKTSYLVISAIFCGLVSAVKLNMGLATFASNTIIIIMFSALSKNGLSKPTIIIKRISIYALVFFLFGMLPYLVFFAMAGYQKMMRFIAVWFVHGNKKPFSHIVDYYNQFLQHGISLNLIKTFILNNINIILITGMILSLFLLRKSRSSRAEKLIVAAIIIFSVFKMHEYLFNWTYYSLTLWFFSPAVIILFWALKDLKDKYKIGALMNFVLAVIGVFILAYCVASSLNINSKAKYYLNLQRGKVYLATRNDVAIFTDTVNYLQDKIKPQEAMQSLFFTSALEYLLDAKEVCWESFNGSATGKILDYAIADSLQRLKTQKPEYILLVNFGGYLNYTSKPILDYVYSNYETVKEVSAIRPLEEYQLLNKITVYKLKNL